VSGVFNAVAIEGDRVGLLVLEGRGAGEGPTASAVMSDIVDVARGLVMPPFIVPTSHLQAPAKANTETRKSPYYIRFNAADRAGSMAEITRALAEANVSIERIVQRGEDREAGSDRMPVVFLTHDTEEGSMRDALIHLSKHEDVAGTPLVIRIEESGSR
jgi:homoserine dehydrogenase